MAFQPIFTKDVDLTLAIDGAAAVDYKCQLRSVKLTPDTNVQKIKTLCPDGQFAEVETPEWQLELGYLYGRDTDAPAAALAQFLLTNQGKKADFVFRPISGDDTEGYSGTVTLMAGGIGGEQGNFSEQTVQLPLDGQPVALTV